MNLTQCKATAAPAASTLTGLLLLGGAVAPILFVAGALVAAAQYPGYAHLTQAISELAATDAPTPWLQATNFIATGGALALFGVGLYRSSGDAAGGLLVSLFGVGTVVQGLAPCDAGCNFVTATGAVHNIVGLTGFLAAIAAAWLHGGTAPGAYRRYSRASAVVALAGFVLWLAVGKGAAIPAANGSLQRLFVGALLCWFLVTAIRELPRSVSPGAWDGWSARRSLSR